VSVRYRSAQSITFTYEVSIMSLIDNLLGNDTKFTTENEESSLQLDEELAMRRMAAAMNALDPTADAEFLQEQQNIVRLNRQAKTNNLAHRQALLLAKANNDPLYAKYAKYNGARLQIREIIYHKYGSKALSRARQLVSGLGVGNKK
jgi:hypothetical protein